MSETGIAGVVTVIGTILSFLGVTGIDAGVINGAVSGIISFVTIGTAIWMHFAHKRALAAVQQ